MLVAEMNSKIFFYSGRVFAWKSYWYNFKGGFNPRDYQEFQEALTENIKQHNEVEKISKFPALWMGKAWKDNGSHLRKGN